MATLTVTKSYFNLLTDEDGDNVVSQLFNDVSSSKTPTPWSVDANKKKKPQAAAAPGRKKQSKPNAVMKPPVADRDHLLMMKPVIYQERPKQKLNLEAFVHSNQQKETAVETELTLKEYEKQLLEKKQALNAVWKPDVERKVDLPKDFESMKLVPKKKDDEDHPVNAYKPKKKESQHRAKVDEKQKLVLDINGFSEPIRRESKRYPAANTSGDIWVKAAETRTAPSFEDILIFPPLQGAPVQP